MDAVFDIKPVAVKKERKKRVLTTEQKQAFITRMKISREKRKLAKAAAAVTDNTITKVVKKVNKTVAAPIKTIPNIIQPQATPTFDYSHFNTLSEHINNLNQTLGHLSRPPPVAAAALPLAPPSSPVIAAAPVAVIAAAPVIAAPSPVAETPAVKRKIWNCGRKCYVYK